LALRISGSHKIPFALQFSAVVMYPEIAFVVIAFERLVSSDIPHHDCASAIMTFRDDPFEVQILQRMILRRHRQTLVPFGVRRPFRHSPRFQHSVHLETKVVMQMTGSVLLNHKTAPAALPAGSNTRWGGLTRLREVAFPGVAVERWRCMAGDISQHLTRSVCLIVRTGLKRS